MTDEEILELYFARSEDAIRETEGKYGRLCRSISRGVLADLRDSEECVNDAWMALWRSIPPKRPQAFGAYVCRTVKNLSLARYRFLHAKKRDCEYESSLEELGECTGASADAESACGVEELTECVNAFLAGLPAEKRILFLRRYWFLEPVKDLAHDYQISEKAMTMRILRIRRTLAEFLKQYGYDV